MARRGYGMVRRVIKAEVDSRGSVSVGTEVILHCGANKSPMVERQLADVVLAIELGFLVGLAEQARKLTDGHPAVEEPKEETG